MTSWEKTEKLKTKLELGIMNTLVVIKHAQISTLREFLKFGKSKNNQDLRFDYCSEKL